ncbi:MAG: hypothetical protein RMZ43_016110 [Nostoc sp. CmiVER01]|uniref:hypothetical protein n=1 Tax=Nostoc sp. CmiVER01 TaxID=3075384 RepID=UPI002ADB78D9|nr:hypothetical protein [Nostoc sp. CmiVER01]
MNFGKFSAIIRKLTKIAYDNKLPNPISLCNILLLKNICALMLLTVIYGQQRNKATFNQLLGYAIAN